MPAPCSQRTDAIPARRGAGSLTGGRLTARDTRQQSLLGRVLVHDAPAMRWRTLRLAPGTHRAHVTVVEHEPGAVGREPSDDLPPVGAAELPDRLRERQAGRDDFLLVDVREPDDNAAHAIPGPVLVPLADCSPTPGAYRPGSRWCCTAPAAPAPSRRCELCRTWAAPMPCTCAVASSRGTPEARGGRRVLTGVLRAVAIYVVGGDSRLDSVVHRQA